MTTISISLDEDTKQEMDALAKQARKSRSDIVRELFLRYRLEKSMQRIETEAAPILQKLGLETEDDIAAFIKHH